MKSNRELLYRILFFTGLLLVSVGFLLSRALLSTGMIVLIVNGFLLAPLQEKWKEFKTEPFLISLALLFLLPFISGLWSDDLKEWWIRCQMKLPLLLLPFAFIQPPAIKRKHLVFFMLLWMILMLAGSGWSIVEYLKQRALFDDLYHQSKVIPTLAGNDHIRYSIGIIVALLFWIKLEEWKSVTQTFLLWFMRLCMVWLIVFLHVTGVKTGLLGLYVSVFPVAVWIAWVKGYKTMVAVVIALALLLPFFAYQVFPTFKARVHYVMYDRHLWKQNEFTGTQSDGNRILSIRSGLSVWKDNFFTGVGFGDIKSTTNLWFETNAPQVAASNRFLPLNQWVMMGTGTGIAGVLGFTFVLLLPFFSNRWRNNKPALFFMLFMSVVFLYESTLEDQRGVFVYTFFTLWWYLTNRIEN